MIVGFEGIALSQIEVAVEEAVTNVQQQVYDAEENSTYDFICELLPAALKITVRERGIPLDSARIPTFKGAQDLGRDFNGWDGRVFHTLAHGRMLVLQPGSWRKRNPSG